MTDHDPLLDELVSAYLDDEATADEVARVESDPRLLARVDELRTVSLAVGITSPTSDTGDRDAVIARAVRELDQPVESLAAARATRTTSPRVWRIAGIAAAIALVFLALPFMLADSDDSETAAVSSDAGGDTAGDTLDEAAGEELAAAPSAEDERAPQSAEVAEDDADDAMAGIDAAGDDGGDYAAGDIEAPSVPDPVGARGLSDDERDRLNGYFDGDELDQALATTPRSASSPACAEVDGEQLAIVDRDTGTVVVVRRGDGVLLVYRVDDCSVVDELP